MIGHQAIEILGSYQDKRFPAFWRLKAPTFFMSNKIPLRFSNPHSRFLNVSLFPMNFELGLYNPCIHLEPILYVMKFTAMST